MDFLGRTYHFMNTEHGHSMKIKIYKVGTEYFAISEFIHPESGNVRTFETPVTISSNMYVESPSINVKDKFNKDGIETGDWRINARGVEEIKVKCKFKGKKMSQVSTILVRHTGMEKWLSYPFSMIGQLVTND